MLIRFDKGPDGQPIHFDGAREVVSAWQSADVPAALERLDQLRADGAWLAGYATYELGYALEPRLLPLMPQDRRLPLLQFAAYDRPTSDQKPEMAGSAGLRTLSPMWDEATYSMAFDKVKTYIGAGDIYQANLTFPITAKAEGDGTELAADLYAALVARQPVGHGACVTQEGLPTLLSRSPELFFRTSSDGVIETRPMKGTQPRSSVAVEDRRRRDFLTQDEKNRAENLMIVDLLRNDISRVAKTGSVHVPELFAVESYATVHQMVSLVRAKLADGKGLSDIFAALFPCGSITGAPKIRAMEILRELEPWPRDIYCGTIGWAAPDGRAEFNVAIRTIMLEGTHATLNVGGGLVWDSTAASEYEEALWKARFAQLMTPTSV